MALPVREWPAGAAEQLAETWSPQLLNERGRQLWDQCARLGPEAREAELSRLGKAGTPIRMKPQQAMMLHEFVTTSPIKRPGVVVNGPVGVGKTLAGYLLALVSHLYFGTSRPLTLVPGSIADDTRRAYVGFAQVWQMPRPVPQVETYEALGKPQNEFALCACLRCTRGEVETGKPALAPDFVFLDESDLLRNPESAVSKRWDRYYLHHQPLTAPGTGTPFRKSLRNLSRHIVWAVGPASSPLPGTWKDLSDWCSAVDESPRDGLRSPPGALLRLADIDPETFELFDDETQLEIVRSAIGRRIAQTPGIVVIDESSCDQPIYIEVAEAEADAAIDSVFFEFRRTGKTPDGWRVGDVFSLMRIGGQMGRGFYQRWNPRPPQEWIEARNAWKAHVENRIESSKRSGRPIDREGVVARLDGHTDVYQEWQRQRQAFGPPNVEAIPLSYSVLAWAARWLQANGPALVWVKERWVGETLSRMTGVPFFVGKGKTESGYRIQQHRPDSLTGNGSAILSVNANRRGRHLPMWNRNLVLGVEHSAERNEQMIGRTHRYEQNRPVHVTYAVCCAEDLRALAAAQSEALNAQAVGRIRQKLLSANWSWNVSPGALQPWTIPETEPGKRARWSHRGADSLNFERFGAR